MLIFQNGGKLFQEGREREGGVNYLRLWSGDGAGFSARGEGLVLGFSQNGWGWRNKGVGRNEGVGRNKWVDNIDHQSVLSFPVVLEITVGNAEN